MRGRKLGSSPIGPIYADVDLDKRVPVRGRKRCITEDRGTEEMNLDKRVPVRGRKHRLDILEDTGNITFR